MNGGPGRLVVHTGGRGLVRVTVTSTDTPAPPLADSLLAVWEDIAEGSFTIESAELCFDGFSGEISQRIPHPGPGPRRARVFARGRTEYWDTYRTPEAQPQIRLHFKLAATNRRPAPRPVPGQVHRKPCPNRRRHRIEATHLFAEKHALTPHRE
ncbi:hypothetical protein ACIQYZ_21705 [Rhodococcus erythropolis]